MALMQKFIDITISWRCSSCNQFYKSIAKIHLREVRGPKRCGMVKNLKAATHII